MSEVIDLPEYYFPNINFNPAFYANEATGFTQAQANALYLRKTVPDTATAVETFNAGINVNGRADFNSVVNVIGIGNDLTVTDSVTAPTKIISISNSGSTPHIDIADATGDLYLSPTSIEQEGTTTKVLNIATGANIDLNVGTGTRSGTGTVGNPYKIHNYSDGDNCLINNGVHLNNGINNGSNTNIHNGTGSAGNVNIMSGASATGAVNLGSTTGTTTVTASGIINLNGVGSTKTNLITIGNSTATGVTTLASPTTNITKVVSNTLDATTATSTMTVGSNLITSGTLNIMGNNVNGGTLNLMGGSLASGTINIGTYTAVPSPVNTVTYLKGDTYLGSASSSLIRVQNGTFESDNIDGYTINGTHKLFSNVTSGSVSCLGTGSATLNVAGSGIVASNIGTTSGTLTIQNNARQVDIGSAGTVNITGTTNINTTTTGTITIGGANITQINSTTIGIGKTNDSFATTVTVLGTTTINTTGTKNTTIGNTTGEVSTTGLTVKQITPLVGGGGSIETVIGNANNLSSLSTTFNRKDVTAGSLAIACYRIVSPAQYNTQYCELVVSGANYGLGGYAAKFYFVLEQPAETIVAPTVNMFYGVNGALNGYPTITFTIESTTTMTLNINCGKGGTTQQTFVSTLIAYPSININNPLNDFSITAI